MEDRDPDPTLHVHSDQRESGTASEEDDETADEGQSSGSGSDDEVNGSDRDSEVEAGEERDGVDGETGGSEEVSLGRVGVHERLKRRKVRGRFVRRFVTSSLEGEDGISRCGISRSKLMRRSKRVVVRKRVRLSTVRQKHGQLV